MTILNGQRVIAIEEHYYDPEMAAHFTGIDATTGGFVRESLEDLGERRIKSMDEAGIDVRVLSHGAPSAQKLDAETGVRVAKAANDRLHETCRSPPTDLPPSPPCPRQIRSRQRTNWSAASTSWASREP